VLWALIQTVGCYPAGTVMRTRAGAVVLSLSPSRTDVRRPHCRVLVRPDGSTPAPDRPELLEPLPGDDAVVEVLDPARHGFQVEPLLAA